MQIENIQSAKPLLPQNIKTNTPLSDVAAGDRLVAQVTKNDGSRATLTLADGTNIEAGMKAYEQLLVGDTVQLEVVQAGLGGTSLRLLEVNGQALGAEVSELTYALMRMEVPSTSAQIAQAMELQQQGTPLAPPVLSKMARVLSAYPELRMEEAALFASSKLAVTEENIQAFRSFTKSPAQAAAFFSALESLSQKEPALIQSFLEKLQTQDGWKPLIPSTLVEGPDAAQAKMPAATVENSAARSDMAAQTALPPGLSAETAKFLTQNGSFASLLQAAPTWSGRDAIREVLLFMAHLPKETPAADRKLLSDTLQAARNVQAAASAGEAPVLLAQTKQEQTPSAKQPIQNGQNTETAGLIQAEKNTVVSEAANGTNAGQVSETLPLLKAPGGGEGGQASVRAQAAVSPETALLGIAKELFARIQGDVPPNEQAAALKEATAHLPEKVSQLADALKQTDSSPAGIKSAADTGSALITQLQMGGEFNHLIYAQLPFMNAQQQPQSAELFMLKRGRNGKEVDAENATVAICLETTRMGRLETLLHVEQNALSIQFRVENESVLQYIKPKLPSLRTCDFPPQYHLKNTGVVLQKDKITPQTAVKTMQRVFRMPAKTGMIDMSI